MRTASSFLLLALAALLLLALPGAAAIKDTIKNRIKLAEQFLEDNPVEDSIEAVARPQMAQIKNPAEVQLFRRNLDSIDMKKLRSTLRHTMIKHFTAPELEYVVDMYSTPMGRAVMGKMGAYTSEITPKLHEAMQPITQMNAEFLAQNMLDQEAANGGVHPDAQGEPVLPARHIKVPDGVYQGSTVNDVLEKKTKNVQKKKAAPATVKE